MNLEQKMQKIADNDPLAQAMRGDFGDEARQDAQVSIRAALCDDWQARERAAISASVVDAPNSAAMGRG